MSTATSAYAQSPTFDSTANAIDTTQKDTKLGARLTIGVLYAFALEGMKSQSNILPIYGIRGGGLFPVGAQVDLTATGDFLLFPGGTYSRPLTAVESINRQAYIALSPPNTPLPPTEKTFTILRSHLVAFHTGFRMYARMKRADALVTAMSPRLQRHYWRKRVDRSGFNWGLNTGPVVGWHKRITRTLPENWPVNEPIPESSMEQSEQTYTRWYWAVNMEFGWTFKGRVDLALGTQVIARLQGDSGSYEEEASDAYAQQMFTGRLSYVLGRACIRVP